MSNRDGRGLDNQESETLPVAPDRRPLLDDDDYGAVGAKTYAIGSPRQLRIFTLGLSEDARRNDTGAEQVIAHGRRALA